jgi:hypothetical protein
MKKLAMLMAERTIALVGFGAAPEPSAGAIVPAAEPLPGVQAARYEVTDYGAVCDGITDDTMAVQRAINAAESAGGGVVEFPGGTCLLNSSHPSRHPWFFYNLIIGSNVKLLGRPGAKLVQGPGGRHALVPGAKELRNTVLAFGPDYAEIRFQQAPVNGGFYKLQGTLADHSSVVLAQPAQAENFQRGDYVAIYETNQGDVIPSEVSQIIFVAGATGVLGLKYPLARSFPNPVIAKVTSLVTTNVGMENLIVQGIEPLAVTETFGFKALNCQFIINTSVGGSNVTCLNLNTLRNFQFIGNTFTSAGPSYAALELTQRNSQDGLFGGNTFIGSSVGFGEYAAHIMLMNNHFHIHANPSVVAGIFIGGLDVTFTNNEVQGGNITGGSGWGALLADFMGPAEYASYVGRIRIAHNTFECQADGDTCLGIFGADTSVTGNRITITGSARGLHVEGPLIQSNYIVGNQLQMGSGDGLVIVTPASGSGGSVIARNTISGSGDFGIHLATRGAPAAGGITLSSNLVTGFKVPVSIR